MGRNIHKNLPLLIGTLFCASCVSYEPAVLVPALTLSAEQISITQQSENQSSLDFGMQVSVNESDSLSNIEVLPGVRVRTVSPNGAADSAGIQAGDIILSVNGLETNHPDVISALQEQSGTEDNQQNLEFSIELRRNTTVLEATLSARRSRSTQALKELYRSDPIATRAGYRTELVDVDGAAGLAAARIVELFPESPLATAGIEVGDLVLTLNGLEIKSAQGLISSLNQDFELGQEVFFGLYDGQNITQRPVKLWDPGRRISQISLGPLLQYQSTLDPPGNNLSILDFWLFSIYEFRRTDGERSHSFLGLFNISSDYGELTEESIPAR